MTERLYFALKIIAVWICNVLVPRPATDGETEMVGQNTGLVDLREWREVD